MTAGDPELPASERADASHGGAGAPPDPGDANRAPADLTREYEGEGIRVQWYAGRCIHSAECIRAQSSVFDPRRRPWIDLRGADAEAVADAVLRCPTGALHFTRLDGGAQEEPPPEVRIRAVRDGPYYVRGPVELLDGEGRVIRRDTRVALCRCGHSKHMPFCDNTHRTIGWRSAPPEG